MQGLDVTAIAPFKSGKTLGYVVPILSAIATNEKVCVFIKLFVLMI